MFRLSLATLAAVAAASCLWVSGVRAENPRVNTQTFRPSPHARDMFATVTSDVPHAWAWSAGLWLSYGLEPLVFVDLAEVAPDHVAIEHQVALHAVGSLALTPWLSVALEVPVFLVQSGDDVGFVGIDEIPSAGLGDMRISAKVAILGRDPDREGFGLGLELPIGLPTGMGDGFVSDGFTFVPVLALDARFGGFGAAVNLGARLRDTTELAQGTSVGSEFVFRVAARYALVPELLTVLGEVHGASHNFAMSNNTYVEGLVGGELELDDGLYLTLAGGRGFASGYGSTAARVVAQVAWRSPRIMPVRDADLDAIEDEDDDCPNEPEDSDGFEDEDGCPDADDDGDGVLDVADGCPRDPEDRDGFEDENGCPDPDNDGDGVPDAQDGPDGSCRDLPEDKDDHADDDGCPDGDNDGDGILDADDNCPSDAGNRCGIDVDPCEVKIDQKILFAYDDDVILAESFPILDALVDLLKFRDAIKRVEVQGHTDNEGDAPYNLTLSERRATSVVAYLTGKGIAAERLSAKGYGESLPLLPNNTASNRAANRRVQFIIVEPALSGCKKPGEGP